MVYSPGDFLDKYSILSIKKKKGLDVNDELEFCKEEFVGLTKSSRVDNVYMELYESNLFQFELEDKIRVEKDLATVGQIALDIRKQNDYRVHLKNKINEICQYKFLEQKDYKRA